MHCSYVLSNDFFELGEEVLQRFVQCTSLNWMYTKH